MFAVGSPCHGSIRHCRYARFKLADRASARGCASVNRVDRNVPRSSSARTKDDAPAPITATRSRAPRPFTSKDRPETNSSHRTTSTPTHHPNRYAHPAFSQPLPAIGPASASARARPVDCVQTSLGSDDSWRFAWLAWPLLLLVMAVVSPLDVSVLRSLTGVFVFALSGAALAARKKVDLVGVITLAGVTGVGGGIVRDVLLGDTPLLALRTPIPLLLAAIAALLVMRAHSIVRRLDRQVNIFDAAGLSLFAVSGAVRTLNAGLGWWAAILLGAVSAVGGVIRDVLAREIPMVFHTASGLYAYRPRSPRRRQSANKPVHCPP